MPSGNHVHIWKYGEPEFKVFGGLYGTPITSYWKVYRFCTECLEGEEIQLKDKVKD